MTKPTYSGPGKTGMCVCGHRWDQHHLHIIMDCAIMDARKEGYIIGQCLAHGHNEAAGMMWNDEDEMVDHCHEYRDTGDLEQCKSTNHLIAS